MAYTELQLAQVERRIAAVERCVVRQRETLKQHIDAGLDTEAPLRELAHIEATQLELRRSCKQIRDGIAAAHTQELLNLFVSLPSQPVPRTTSHPVFSLEKSRNSSIGARRARQRQAVTHEDTADHRDD